MRRLQKLSCIWTAFLLGSKTFFLADENKSIATLARDRNGSAEETTSKLRASSDFSSRTFTGTFSSTIIGRIYFRGTFGTREFVAWKFMWRHMSTFHFTSPSHACLFFLFHFLPFMFLLHSFCTYSQIGFISQEMDPPEAVYLHCKYNICNVKPEH